jgi:hypothetical protein
MDDLKTDTKRTRKKFQSRANSIPCLILYNVQSEDEEEKHRVEQTKSCCLNPAILPHEDVVAFLTANGITMLYHYTDKKNLRTIKQASFHTIVSILPLGETLRGESIFHLDVYGFDSGMLCCTTFIFSL